MNVAVRTNMKSEKSTNTFALSLSAGILILINAVALGIVANWYIGIMPILPGSTGNDPTLLLELATFGLICGILVLLGTIMLNRKPENKKVWGIMILAFSVPSVIMGGGFIIGFILGIIGGAKAVSLKPKMQATNPATTS